MAHFHWYFHIQWKHIFPLVNTFPSCNSNLHCLSFLYMYEQIFKLLVAHLNLFYIFPRQPFVFIVSTVICLFLYISENSSHVHPAISNKAYSTYTPFTFSLFLHHVPRSRVLCLSTNKIAVQTLNIKSYTVKHILLYGNTAY